MGADRYRKAAFEHALDRLELPGSARTTGLVLVHFMGADGVAWVGQRRLADRWNVKRKRFAADLAALEAVGLVEVQARSGPHGTSRYRSRARFVGESADIVLEDGQVLPARSSGSALEGSARSSGSALTPDEVPACSPESALGVDRTNSPARSFEVPARSFGKPACSPGNTIHHSTSPPLGGGGGGGGAVPAAATADAAAAGPAEERARSSIDAVLDELEALVRGKVAVPRFNQRLNGLISAKIGEGWEPASLARVVLDNPPPVKPVSDPAAWWAKRLSGVQIAPVCVHARPTPAGAPAAQKRGQRATEDCGSDEVLSEPRRMWQQYAIELAGYPEDLRPYLGVLSRAAVDIWRANQRRLGDEGSEDWEDFAASMMKLRPPAESTCVADLTVFMDVTSDLFDRLCGDPTGPDYIDTEGLDGAILFGSWHQRLALLRQFEDLSGFGSASPAWGPKMRGLKGLVAALGYPSAGEVDFPFERRCEQCGSLWFCKHRPQSV